MISLETIDNEIMELEKRDTTFAVAERLAWLYIVRDHIQTPQADVKTLATHGSEFLNACSGIPADQVLAVLDEHLELIRAVFPKEYTALLAKINSLKP